jgi:tetratricopeptide (TPR) repeat protein
VKALAGVVLALAVLTAPARAQDADTEAARDLSDRAMMQYDLGHYREALRTFEQAKATRPLPAFDYNIGRCYEQLGQWRQAIDAYERYVKSQPPPVDAAEVRDHTAALRRRLALSPLPAPPSPPSTSRRSGLAKTIAGAVLGGVGVALIGGGIVAGVDGDRKADQLSADDLAGRPFDPALERSLRTDRDAEVALFVVGGAAAATGVVLIILGQRDRAASRYAWRR